MDFQPYEYRPRFAGPPRPTVAPTQDVAQGPSMADIFGQIGTVGFFSRSFAMEDVYDPVNKYGTKTFFLLFPGDVALERVMFAWNQTSLDGGGGNTSVDIVIEQLASYDVSGVIKRQLFSSALWDRAVKGQSYIYEPIDRIEAFTPILATIRCLNSTDPLMASFFEADGLELWMTMHLLAGRTA